MIFRESRRFFKSSPWLSVTGVFLLTVGVGVSALTYCLLSAFSAPRFPGLRNQGYATIGAGESSGVLLPLSWLRIESLQRRGGKLTRLAVYSPVSPEVDAGAGITHRKIRIAAVSGGFFSRFTSPLLVGRDLSEAEAEDFGQHVVVLGATLSGSLFGSPQQALGRSVTLNGAPYQVIGVTAPAFHGLFGDGSEAWTPAHSVIPLEASFPAAFGDSADLWKTLDMFYVLAEDQQRTSESLAASLAQELPRSVGGTAHVTAVPGISFDPGRDTTMRRWLRLGLGFAVVLAIVSCLNVCMLLLARAPLLVEEVKLKQALGGGIGRIVGELVAGPVAMMLLGVIGALLLWATVLWSVERLSDLNAQLLRGSVASMAGALSVTLLLALGLVAAVALVPAIAVMRASQAPRMGSTTTASRYTVFIMQAQVSTQIGCGIVIAILASMITASLLAEIHQPLGYDPARRLIVSMEPVGGSLTFSGTTGASAEFLALNRVMQQLRSLPQVRSVSYIGHAPFGVTPLVTETVSNPETPAAEPCEVERESVTSGYFRTAGSRILHGRDLSDWLSTGIDHEAVINLQLAGRLFGKNDPVGKTMFIEQSAHNGLAAQRYALTVVGVVENSRNGGYASSPRPTFYQEAHAWTDAMPYMIVDSDLTGRELEMQTQAAAQRFMLDFKVRRVYSLSSEVDEALAPDRNRAMVALSGAAVMAVVACIGLYSALMFFVRSKRKEIALRICLGATPRAIRRLVVARAFKAAAFATLLSLPMWLLMYRLSANNLLGAASWSTQRAVLITFVGGIVSILLAIVPAVRATSETPAGVLKEQ